MAKVPIEVTLPGILASCVGGERTVVVEAETLSGIIDALLVAYPLLRVHLFSDKGELREHLMFLYNDQSTDWLESMDLPVREGDRLTVFQLVSGG